MRFLSLFAGIGGFDLGLERAGWQCVGQVEIDPFCQKVLAKHWPNVWRFEDVRGVTAKLVREHCGSVDAIVGGFPCQDISFAGKGAGIEGERSGLWAEYHRLICEIRPRFVVVENVAALLNRGMGRVLGDLAARRYDAEWRVFSACELGAPHTRERVFIIAYPAGNRQQGNLCQVIAQAFSHIPPKALGTWNPSGSPFTNFAKFLGESGSCRMADGISSTLDIRPRLRAYGNAVVPQIAEVIGRAILQMEAA